MKIALEWEFLCKEERWNMFPSWWCVWRKTQKLHKDMVSLEKGGRARGFYNSETVVLCSAFFCLHSVSGNCCYRRELLWLQEDFPSWFKPSYSELHILLFCIKGMTCWFQPVTLLFPLVVTKIKVKSNLTLSKDDNLKKHLFL